MKGFQFKLQTVLDYRAKEVDQQQQQVAVEEKKRLDIFELIKQREREIKEAFILFK
ncbi:MAG: hypothetical protein K2X66_05790 [Cyanobacteria bacterium]|nr:hypothetical protein [Cyanobacteriota bacterium]